MSTSNIIVCLYKRKFQGKRIPDHPLYKIIFLLINFIELEQRNHHDKFSFPLVRLVYKRLYKHFIVESYQPDLSQHVHSTLKLITAASSTLELWGWHVWRGSGQPTNARARYKRGSSLPHPWAKPPVHPQGWACAHTASCDYFLCDILPGVNCNYISSFLLYRDLKELIQGHSCWLSMVV